MLYVDKKQEKLYKNFEFPNKLAFNTIKQESRVKKASYVGSLIGVGIGF